MKRIVSRAPENMVFLDQLHPLDYVGLKAEGCKYLLEKDGDGYCFRNGYMVWAHQPTKKGLIEHTLLNEEVEMYAFEGIESLANWIIG